MTQNTELKGLENAFINFTTTPRKEKVVLGGIEPGIHYTIHIGTVSGALDVHIKNELTNEYTTLFKMKHYSFFRLLVRLKPIQTNLIRKLWFTQKLNIGKLKRHGLFLIPIDIPESHQSAFIRIEKNGKKFRPPLNFDVEKIKDLLLFPEDIVDHPSKGFQVYSLYNGSMKGLVYKDPLKPFSRKVYFVNKKTLNLYHKKLFIVMINLLAKTNFTNKPEILSIMRNKFFDKYPYDKKTITKQISSQ